MSRNAWEANESLDTITVTLTNDDYWRIRQALAESATMHSKAVDRCTGTNQRSTDVILHHEHVIRRLQDVEDKLKEAADQAYAQEAQPVRDGFCLDCNRELVPTGDALAEWFAVTDEVWTATGLALHGLERGNLCVGCLEERLGRRLVPADFSDAPINDLSIRNNERAWSWRTPRLINRLAGHGPLGDKP